MLIPEMQGRSPPALQSQLYSQCQEPVSSWVTACHTPSLAIFYPRIQGWCADMQLRCVVGRGLSLTILPTLMEPLLQEGYGDTAYHPLWLLDLDASQTDLVKESGPDQNLPPPSAAPNHRPAFKPGLISCPLI